MENSKFFSITSQPQKLTAHAYYYYYFIVRYDDGVLRVTNATTVQRSVRVQSRRKPTQLYYGAG